MIKLKAAGSQSDSFDGYAVPAGRYVADPGRGPRYFVTLGLWALVLVTAMTMLSMVASRVTDVPSRYNCPPDCGRPPTGIPVATNPRFTAPGGEFSVSYPAPGASYNVTVEPNGVTATWTAGDGGTLRLFSQPAQGRNAEQVAKVRAIIEELGYEAASPDDARAWRELIAARAVATSRRTRGAVEAGDSNAFALSFPPTLPSAAASTLN